MIERVQPVYNPLEYWHRWKPYAHKCLSKYTDDADIHGNLDSDLWFLFKRICDNFDEHRYVRSYIIKSIRGIVKRCKDKKGYKYLKWDYVREIKESEAQVGDNLDITLDEYIASTRLNRFMESLPERHREIIKDYYGLDNHEQMNLREIAEKLQVSQSRVTQIKDRAIAWLKSIAISHGINKTEDLLSE